MTRHDQSQEMWMECRSFVSKTYENDDRPNN